MKNMTTEKWRNRILLCAAWSSGLFAVGCTCVTVQINWPSSPTAAPQSASPVVRRIYGGPFTPVFGSIAGTAGTQTISCGSGGSVTVQKKYVDLILPVNGQQPNPGETAFVGRLIKSNTTTMVVTDIPNADYLLRLTAGLSTFTCCESMLPDPYFVKCSVNPIYVYRFKAYWKPGVTVPAANERVYLLGGWTTL